MEGDSVDRLRELVAESDAVIVEECDSPDPVARRRVFAALWAKARALAKLERYEECVGVWDELIVRFAEEPPADDPLFVARMLLNKALDEQRSGQECAAIGTLDRVLAQGRPRDEDVAGWLLAGRAVSLKRDVLIGLRQLEAAAVLDGEIIARFGETAEPELRGRVAFALAHRAYVSLHGHRVDEALRDSDELIRRFRGEDDPVVLGRIAKLLLSQAGSLLRVGGPSVHSVMFTAAVTLAGAVGEGARFAGQRLRLDRAPCIGQLQRLGGSAATTSVSRLRVAVVVAQQRRRAAQTLVISREIVDRFAIDDEPDRQQMVATASIQGALALIFLGHVLEGVRRVEQLTDSGREAVAEAFRGQATGLRSEHGVLEELGAVANLAHRARTLGQGDPRIARLAFEESMRPGAPGSPASRRARWIARLIGPGKS